MTGYICRPLMVNSPYQWCAQCLVFSMACMVLAPPARCAKPNMNQAWCAHLGVFTCACSTVWSARLCLGESVPSTVRFNSFASGRKRARRIMVLVYARTGGSRTGGYRRVARPREVPRGACHCPQALSTPSLDYESFLLVYVSCWPVGGFALACRNSCVTPAVALPQLAACLATVLIE